VQESDISNRASALSAIDVHIGARLRTLREARGMAQAELGRAIGVSEAQLQSYETGTARIDAARLFGITRALGIAVKALFAGLA
jgi:transcriptional regulator with XRE-family HTH domain